jgi:hypothetical protein
MKVRFKKNVDMDLYKATKGMIVQMTAKKSAEEIAKGNVEEYTGQFPPRLEKNGSKNKMRVNLKDLK